MIASLENADTPRTGNITLPLNFHALLRSEIEFLKNDFISPLIDRHHDDSSISDHLESCNRQVMRIEQALSTISRAIYSVYLSIGTDDLCRLITPVDHPFHQMVSDKSLDGRPLFVPRVSLPENCTDILMECSRILAYSADCIAHELDLEETDLALCETLYSAVTEVENVCRLTHLAVQQTKEKDVENA